MYPFKKNSLTIADCLLICALLSLALLTTAYALQYLFGYKPCELCLQQRAFWWILLAICTIAQLMRSSAALYFIACACSLLMLASACLAIYHAGGERGWWSLALFCKGLEIQPNLTVQELHDLLLTQDVVTCNKPSLRLLGLSLAEYNVLFSLSLAVLLATKLWSKCNR